MCEFTSGGVGGKGLVTSPVCTWVVMVNSVLEKKKMWVEFGWRETDEAENRLSKKKKHTISSEKKKCS